MSHAIRQPKHIYHLPHGINSSEHASSLVIPFAQALWIATGLIIELLAIRFMIAFLGANPSQTVFHYIYSISQPFVNPFMEVANQTYPSGSFVRFEAPTLIAIALYALFGYGIARLLTKSQPAH